MTVKKFAGIVDGDIFTILSVDDEFQGSDGEAGGRIIAGLLSDPIFVEIPENLDVNLNWKWENTEFIEG
jgi:hypothetical protein